MKKKILGCFLLMLSFSVFSGESPGSYFGVNYNPYVDPKIPKSLDSFGSGESCKAINNKVNVPSQIYTIAPLGKPKDVYCDMDNFGGGWTLLYSFGSSPVSEFALIAGGINTSKELRAAGLKYKLTNINLTKYGVYKDAMQLFTSGSGKGFVEFKIPLFAQHVRIDANARRYDGWVNIIKNGKRVFSLTKNTPKKPVYLSVLPGDRIRIEEDGILWLSSVWVR